MLRAPSGTSHMSSPDFPSPDDPARANDRDAQGRPEGANDRDTDLDLDVDADGAASSGGDEPPPIMPVATEGSLYWKLRGVLATMRPHQWVKNVFVLAPIVFAQDLFERGTLLRAASAFFVFCLLAGAVYTINDIVDVEADRVHPVKRKRPIPSGRVPIGVARGLVAVLLAAALVGAELVDHHFAMVALSYLALNLAYSFKLKKVAWIDVGCIATGFVLRVVAGGYATGIYVSNYLLACTALLALFLGFGKRRHELSAVAHGAKAKQRAALEAYTTRSLTSALAVTGTAAVATYFAYTVDAKTRLMFHSDWLWLTTPFTIFGVVRFLQLVRGRPKAESPTQEMLRDTPFVLNLVTWVLVVLVLVYNLRPTGR